MTVQGSETLRVVEDFFAALEALDIEAFMKVWSDRGVQEMPFAPEGFPRRLDGKAAIERQYSGLPTAYRSMRFPRSVELLADHRRALAQYTGVIELRDGRHYDNRYVGVFVVEGGKVVLFTEYFDPIVLSRAFDPAALGSTFSLGETK